MDMMDVASILQDVADKNAQMVELMQTKFAQDFQKVTANTVGDPNKTTIQRIDAAIAAMDTLIKSMGVYSTKTNSALAEIKKDLKEVHTGSGKDLSSDEITAVVTRRMKEWTVNKNENVLNYETKKAKSSESTQTIKKEFSEKIVEKMDSCTDRLIQFFTGESDPDKVKKKNKSFIADFVTAIATNKAVGGIFEDLVKLVALFGASFLAQFGTIGKLVGAGLVMFLPALAPVLLNVLGKFASNLIGGLIGAFAPYLAPLLIIGAAIGGLYWLFNTDKGKETQEKFGLRTPTDENGRPVSKFRPGALNFYGGDGTDDYDSAPGYLYDSKRRKKKNKLSEEDWQKAIGVKNFAFDTNTGTISNSALMASENVMGAWDKAYSTMPEHFSRVYENVDLGNEELQNLFTKDSFKYSATNRFSKEGEAGFPTHLLAGKGMTENLFALNDLNKAIGGSVHVYEGGVQTAGSYTKKDFNPHNLSGTGMSLNAQNALSLLLGDFQLNGKKVSAHEYRKVAADYLSKKEKRTPAEERLLRMLMGGHIAEKGGKAILSDDLYTGEGESYFQATSKIATKSGVGNVETTKPVTSTDYTPPLPKVPEIDKGSENKGYDGKEIKSEAYPLPDVKQINVDKESLPEVEPPNFNKDGGLDIIGNARTSRILARLNNISLFSADTALGGQIA